MIPSRLLLLGPLALAIALGCGGAGGGPDAPSPAPAPAAAATPQAPALDALLAGVEAGCGGNDRLSDLLSSIAEPGPDFSWKARPSVLAPPELAGAFGAPVLRSGDDEHSVFSVPVTGATWLGIPVVRIDRWVGHGNGINGFAVVVASDAATVESTVRAKLTITDSCAGVEDCPTEPSELSFTATEGGTSANCDTSN
jgi:hypothetical protein